MPDLRTDAQLVTAYTAGDRGALAGIYDRYSPGLYDTAAAMLRDRHEAADAMQDVILIAAERMAQLREPERLKPWLYAILRNEVYRRTKKRGRTLPTDFSAMGAPEVAAPIAPDADGEALSAAELGELVRSAACGLDERDQLVLELSVRQGLQGADLAAALGVTAEQSYTLVHRMRDRVDRSLGALVVARAGRKACPELADVLRGWDGEFTVLVRKRVARHIEHCETCEHTRKKAAPLALLGSAPAFAAPAALRDSILAKAGRPGSVPSRAYQFDVAGGFPRVASARRLSTFLMIGVAAVIAGVGVGALVATSLDDGPAATPATTIAVATTPAPDISIEPATSPSSTSSTSSTTSTTSTTLAPVPGSLVLTATVVDLGAGDQSEAFTVGNPGALPIDWTVDGAPQPFTLVNAGGTLQPGQSQVVTVAIDRGALGEGTIERTVTLFDSNGVGQKMLLRARVERAPRLSLNGPAGVLSACDPGSKNVTVDYTDESAIAFPARVDWSGPESGSNALKQRANTSVFGDILISGTDAGIYSYTVFVTDVRGNVASVSGSFEIQPCPG